jgi:hypothetical protein
LGDIFLATDSDDTAAYINPFLDQLRMLQTGDLFSPSGDGDESEVKSAIIESLITGYTSVVQVHCSLLLLLTCF